MEGLNDGPSLEDRSLSGNHTHSIGKLNAIGICGS